MSEMNRERFEDLKEAYALGALSEAERREVEGYLTLHPELNREVADLVSISNMLALAPPEYEPSPELRRNLLQTVNSEASSGRAEQPSMLAKLRGYLNLRTLVPAALALVTVALLGWNVLLQSEVQELQGELQKRQTFAMQGSGPASNTEAEVVQLEDGRAIVIANGMPVPPEGKTMQIWVIQEGTPQPAGTFNPREETVATTINDSLSAGDTVAITVEPAGGSDQPTGQPVLQTDIPT